MSDTYHEQPFLEHFLDAIVLCEMAESLPHLAVSRHASLARSSIMSATFSLEAAANALMAPLLAPRRLIELIDQGKILDKYEFVLFGARPKKKFDRGTAYMQTIRELFDIRNKYVHPRTRKRTITHRKLGDGSITIQKQDSTSNQLNLPASPEDWGGRDALRVLKAVSDFLDYFILDLCEIEPELLPNMMLGRMEIDGRSGPFLTAAHRIILKRAFRRWPEIEFRTARSLFEEEEADSSGDTIKILFLFSWGLGGLQLHEQTKVIEVDGDKVTTEVLVDATQQFLLWFSEAEHFAYGRRLIRFEMRSEDRGQRFGTFRTFLTDWTEEKSKGTGAHRPIGRIPGTAKNLFFNAILGVAREENLEFSLTALLDNGSGRVFRMSFKSATEFMHSVSLNKRADWKAEEVSGSEPESIETKGRDYEVEEVDIVTFDPTSKTAFWTYKARSGNLIQVNMKPATMMAMYALISREVFR